MVNINNLKKERNIIYFDKNKFGSKKKKDKPTLDGFVFDSSGELKRYCELKLLVRAKQIKGLEVHPKFVLKKATKNDFGQKISKWTYTADFGYYCNVNQCKVVEDIKSLRVDKKGKKHGTATLRDFKLTRNHFMRQNPDIKFIEIYY